MTRASLRYPADERHTRTRRWLRFAAVFVAVATVCALPLVASATPTDDWPTFGHDQAHSGVSPDTSPNTSNVSSLTQKWKTAITPGSAGILASPVVVYNTTLATDVVYAATKGKPAALWALNASTGAKVWAFTSPAAIVDTPAVAHNVVYFGTHDHKLYALNATTGTQICSYSTTGLIEASPAVANVDGTGDVVFFGDIGFTEKHNAGHEWAVNGVGNSKGQCTLKWSFNKFGVTSGGVNTGSWSPPAVVQDAGGRWLDVFGSSNPDDSVYALDAVAGTQVWRFATTSGGDADVGAGPSVTAPGVNGFADGEVYVPGKNQMFYALDLVKGTKTWSFNLKANAGTGAKSICAPAIVGRNVVCPYNTFVYNLDAVTGALTWRSPTTGGGTFVASAAISGSSGSQVVFAGDSTGTERAYSLATGAALFSFSAPPYIASSAAVVGNTVFFGDVNGSEYALG